MPFKPGESGNKNGCTTGAKVRREHIARLLDEAFTHPDGSDLLVDAIVDGVAERDPTCMKLACQYRLGSPEQFVRLYGEDGGPIRVSAATMSDDELAAIAAKGKA